MSNQTNTSSSYTNQQREAQGSKEDHCAVTVDGNEEELFYRIAPCGGVKRCSIEDCSYTTSVKEQRPCPNHTDVQLTAVHDCPVEFVYVWPLNNNDKRRWLSGIIRRGDLSPNNLHNHPLHGPTKVPYKVALCMTSRRHWRSILPSRPMILSQVSNSCFPVFLLDTGYISATVCSGKGMPYLPAAASLAAAHKGRIKKTSEQQHCVRQN